MLQFAAACDLPSAAVDALGDRLQPVTLAALVTKGAKRFGWIKPSEDLPGLYHPPIAGAFAYVLQDRAVYFPVIVDDA